MDGAGVLEDQKQEQEGEDMTRTPAPEDNAAKPNQIAARSQQAASVSVGYPVTDFHPSARATMKNFTKAALPPLRLTCTTQLRRMKTVPNAALPRPFIWSSSALRKFVIETRTIATMLIATPHHMYAIKRCFSTNACHASPGDRRGKSQRTEWL